MEKALCMPEIIRVICEHLTDGSTLSTALACRAFLEPGLNQHWRCIVSFEPLVACLPADLWRSEKNGSYTTLFLRRSITPEDLHRYRTFYAKRIRWFKPSFYSMRQVLSIQALHGLQLATDWEFGALCPLLTSLTWYTGPYDPSTGFIEHIFPFLSIFLGKNVHSLALTVSPSDPLYVPFLRSALSRLHGLKHLRVIGISPGNVATVDDTATLSLDKHITSVAWDRLETLIVTYISEVAIAHLAQLPCLATLNINNLVSHLATPPANGIEGNHSPSSCGFSSLRSVTINVPVLTDIASFFRYLLPENQLKLVSIAARTYTSASDLQSTIRTIQHQCQPTMLESLIIKIHNQPREDLDPVMHPEPDISPLFAFNQLETLVLCIDGGLSLMPDVVERIPLAWPNIKCLEISSLYPNSKLPHIDHTHLVALARRCSALKSVGLLFDATQISDQDAHTSMQARGLPVNYLRVGHSPIRSPTLVTAFLRAHFPQLVLVDFHGYQDNGELPLVVKRWAAVAESILQGSTS